MKSCKRFLVAAVVAFNCLFPLQTSAIEQSVEVKDNTFTISGSDFGQLNHIIYTKNRYSYEVSGGELVQDETYDDRYEYYTVYLNKDSTEVSITLIPTGRFRENTEVIIFDTNYYLMEETLVNGNICPRGDINMDGSISIADVVLLQKYLLGDSNLSFIQYNRADVNSDSIVDCFDMVTMRQNIVKILNSKLLDF